MLSKLIHFCNFESSITNNRNSQIVPALIIKFPGGFSQLGQSNALTALLTFFLALCRPPAFEIVRRLEHSISDSVNLFQIPSNSFRFFQMLSDFLTFSQNPSGSPKIVHNLSDSLRIPQIHSYFFRYSRYFQILSDSLRFPQIPSGSFRLAQILPHQFKFSHIHKYSLKLCHILSDSVRLFQVSSDSFKFLQIR